jgi:NAD(P)-dependent dehydrogenase (short-subunit alcohol dehydrogenase family)
MKNIQRKKRPKVVVITGGSAGIGRAAARRFAKDGARIGLLLRRWLRSAERFSELTVRRGSSQVNTPLSRSSALLISMTCFDQRLGLAFDMGLRFFLAIMRRSSLAFLVSDVLYVG